ncbi:type II toxin-antitoxin system HipA family toxin [Endozoicomonas sp.]|uniref:type II toxin-antitoxin system HipA family toxin n=1 Tax=Endozoicomonas sp. TaxID=1892382 RepID=UPI0028845081|nr:HipA domain-containing protein [Endozoicomonas sp.]
MTSEPAYRDAFVWIWLPDSCDPVVAGRLVNDNGYLLFNYGKSYLQRPDAIPIYEPELPLRSGQLPLVGGLSMPGCIRDGSPDAWGRRVIINQKLGLQGNRVDTAELDELTYLLESGSDRIGALDFQCSPTNYIPRLSASATLEQLLTSAERIEQGLPVPKELEQALHHGTSIGGARPKALIEDGDNKYIAKFSSSSDLYSVVKAEFIAMRLASLTGLNVADVSLAQAAGKDVLLIRRFDRELTNKTNKGWCRKHMVSALTLHGLDEMMARYTSYEQLADLVRQRFSCAPQTLRELFGRLVFNILCGNTDDHARNHAAFWDGRMLTLTPAYDICPQGRTRQIATQAMLIKGNQRQSQLSLCLQAADIFLLTREQAKDIIEHQKATIEKFWVEVCDEAELSEVDRTLFRGRQFLNPYSFENYPGLG